MFGSGNHMPYIFYSIQSTPDMKQGLHAHGRYGYRMGHIMSVDVYGLWKGEGLSV